MTDSTKALHRFSAFELASIATLFRALGVFDMEITEALQYVASITLLTVLLITTFYILIFLKGSVLNLWCCPKINFFCKKNLNLQSYYIRSLKNVLTEKNLVIYFFASLYRIS